MKDAIQRTSSGSFLVLPMPMKSVQKVPAPVLKGLPVMMKPDWNLARDSQTSYMSYNTLVQRNARLTESLKLAQEQIKARDLMLEGTSAQLVFQHMYLNKLNEALHAKESRKKDDRAVLFAGKAVALTADEFEEKLKAAAQRKADEAMEKEQRATTWASRKDARSALGAQWEAMRSAHTAAVEKWQAECEQLTMQGVSKKQLPKKPVRPKKPSLPEASATPLEEAATTTMLDDNQNAHEDQEDD
jgi:hypothetical protein